LEAGRRTLRDANEFPPGARSPSFGSVLDLLLRRCEVGAGPGGQRLGSATSCPQQMLAGLIQNPGSRSFSGHLCFGL